MRIDLWINVAMIIDMNIIMSHDSCKKNPEIRVKI